MYINNDINIIEGIELINRALKLNPGSYNYMDTKGWSLFKVGRYEESLEFLEKSWDLRPLYDHETYLHIQEAKQALSKQQSEQ